MVVMDIVSMVITTTPILRTTALVITDNDIALTDRHHAIAVTSEVKITISDVKKSPTAS